MNHQFIERQRFACKAGEIVEIDVIGLEKTIVIITDKDGNKKTTTVSNDYLDNAILKSSLTPLPETMESYVIQREQDKKYYVGKGRWIKTIHRATQFTGDTIDSVIAVLRDRQYNVSKIAWSDN